MLVREQARRLIAGSPERDRIARLFEQPYKDFVAENPELAGEVGLAGFLQTYFAYVEQNPAENLIAPLKIMSDAIEEIHRQSHAQLQGWEDSPVGKLHNRFYPAFLNAWRLELTAATLEHAEAILRQGE